MTDPDTAPAGFTDLPIQPTGSGVADLEIAYEQMRLADGLAGSEPAEAATMPVETGDDAMESAAHPS